MIRWVTLRVCKCAMRSSPLHYESVGSDELHPFCEMKVPTSLSRDRFYVSYRLTSYFLPLSVPFSTADEVVGPTKLVVKDQPFFLDPRLFGVQTECYCKEYRDPGV